MKNVSYQIPFTQPTADGNTAWLDIANNHRYTIAVTKWKIHSPLPPSVHFKVIPQIHSKVPP